MDVGISQDFRKTTKKKLQKTYCLAENELKFIWEYGALLTESNKESIKFCQFWKSAK